jgi:hypothetical protein
VFSLDKFMDAYHADDRLGMENVVDDGIHDGSTFMLHPGDHVRDIENHGPSGSQSVTLRMEQIGAPDVVAASILYEVWKTCDVGPAECGCGYRFRGSAQQIATALDG